MCRASPSKAYCPLKEGETITKHSVENKSGKLENIQILLLEMDPLALLLQVFIRYIIVTADIKEFSYETPDIAISGGW